MAIIEPPVRIAEAECDRPHLSKKCPYLRRDSKPYLPPRPIYCSSAAVCCSFERWRTKTSQGVHFARHSSPYEAIKSLRGNQDPTGQSSPHAAIKSSRGNQRPLGAIESSRGNQVLPKQSAPHGAIKSSRGNQVLTRQSRPHRAIRSSRGNSKVLTRHKQIF